MIKFNLILPTILILGSCGFIPPPNPPTPPTPTPIPECLPGIPWCDAVGQQCSTPEVPCKHNPTQDPNHCELAPNCPEPPIPPVDPCSVITCEVGYHCEDGKCVKDDVSPVPPGNICPKELAPSAYVYLNDKAYGNGFDSTVRVHGDTEFCRIIHGIAIDDCHLEGWPKKVECELKLTGGCNIWQYTTDVGTTIYPCNDDQNALASCDHFGDPIDRDDPQTPTSGDTLDTLVGFEGKPKQCGLQRNQFGPNAGYFTIAHGGPPGCTSNGPFWHVRACLPDGTNCGPWRPFCK